MSTLPAMSWAEFSRRMNRGMVDLHGEWCGVPVPLPRLSLTVEDRNPWKARIDIANGIVNEGETPSAGLPDGTSIINSWYSTRLGRRIWIARDEKGVFPVLGEVSTSRRFSIAFNTMWAAEAWSLDTETTAIDALAGLLKPHTFHAYVMTGSFLETSRRSGVTYVFRRLRPTLAIRDMRVLAALCLHPIGYYAESFAGSMVPTDDVIAHLLLMRGDEPMFWRRANQHPHDAPEAGL